MSGIGPNALPQKIEIFIPPSKTNAPAAKAPPQRPTTALPPSVEKTKNEAITEKKADAPLKPKTPSPGSAAIKTRGRSTQAPDLAKCVTFRKVLPPPSKADAINAKINALSIDPARKEMLKIKDNATISDLGHLFSDIRNIIREKLAEKYAVDRFISSEQKEKEITALKSEISKLEKSNAPEEEILMAKSKLPGLEKQPVSELSESQKTNKKEAIDKEMHDLNNLSNEISTLLEEKHKVESENQ